MERPPRPPTPSPSHRPHGLHPRVRTPNPYGGVPALKEQLHHLITAIDKGVGVRVLRAGTPTTALTHSWTLLCYSKAPEIVHIELPNAGLYLHAPETDLYRQQRAHLLKTACPIAETRHFLNRYAAAW